MEQFSGFHALYLRQSKVTYNFPKSAMDKSIEEHREFWKGIIYKDGKIDEEQVMKELSDFSDFMDRFGSLLCEVTGNRMSKLNYTKGAMISCANDHLEECVNDALAEREQEHYESVKMQLEELLDRICPKGGKTLSRGEAIVELAKMMMENYHEIKCPDCGIVQARVEGWESPGKPLCGICPKCNETLYFG